MANPLQSYHLVSGTNTAYWIDSQRWYNAYGITAKLTFNKEDVPMCGTLIHGSYVTGAKGTGSIDIYKTDSRNLELVDMERPNLPHEIIYVVDNPETVRSERIRLIGVTFDEVTLAAYQAAQVGKVTMPFTFDDWKPMEKMEAVI